MRKIKNIKNPYATKDGSPLNGKEEEYFAWAKQKAAAELAKLPKNKQKEMIASEKALAKRMNS